MLIGGFQAKQSELQLLFYKFQSPISDFKLNIEHLDFPASSRESDSPQMQIEELVNQTHVNGDGFLSSVLSMRAVSGDYDHFFIFHER